MSEEEVLRFHTSRVLLASTYGNRNERVWFKMDRLGFNSTHWNCQLSHFTFRQLHFKTFRVSDFQYRSFTSSWTWVWHLGVYPCYLVWRSLMLGTKMFGTQIMSVTNNQLCLMQCAEHKYVVPNKLLVPNVSCRSSTIPKLGFPWEFPHLQNFRKILNWKFSGPLP